MALRRSDQLALVGRSGALDPLEPHDRGRFAGDAGQDGAPAGQAAGLFGAVAQRECFRADREHGGVGGAVADDAHRCARAVGGDVEKPQAGGVAAEPCLPPARGADRQAATEGASRTAPAGPPGVPGPVRITGSDLWDASLGSCALTKK